jgi:hypothetical protein
VNILWQANVLKSSWAVNCIKKEWTLSCFINCPSLRFASRCQDDQDWWLISLSLHVGGLCHCVCDWLFVSLTSWFATCHCHRLHDWWFISLLLSSCLSQYHCLHHELMSSTCLWVHIYLHYMDMEGTQNNYLCRTQRKSQNKNTCR